ncbi:MAG TPA: ferritin-like domain-containing protein [Candidatus Bathyarchaeia archaeon]|nr:ferritin-like domain-containing protein [Candidatus Bathyarchaeia archaeon]
MKGRERIINDIETVDQAVKAEKDVEIGYHGVVDENITYWLAVEEDIIESYNKLLKQTDNKKIKTVLARIIGDSENHVRILTSIKKSFNRIMQDEQRHAELLESLRTEFHK